MTSVLIVDGNDRLGRLMRDLLDDDHRFQVVGVVGTLDAAIAQARVTQPDVALVAHQLAGADGALVCASLREVTPGCALLLWSLDPESTRALGLDVDGVLERGMTYHELARAVRAAAKGRPGGPRTVDLTDGERRAARLRR